MCCVARRRPQPCHRWLYSSPYTRTQGTKRFNILSASSHPGARVWHVHVLVWTSEQTFVLMKKEKTICATLPHFSLTVLLAHDESSSVRHVRRMFHPGRGLGGSRARRTNMHFTSSSTGGLSSSSSQSSTYTPSNREAMDPIAGEKQEYTGPSLVQY